MKCKFCNREIYDQFRNNRFAIDFYEFNGIKLDLYNLDFLKAQQLLVNLLLENIYESENLEIFKDFDPQIPFINEAFCNNCNVEFNYNMILHLRLYLRDSLYKLIEYKLTKYSIEILGYDILNTSYLPKIEHRDIIDEITIDLNLKNQLNKMNIVYKYLGPNYPVKFSPEKGGDGFQDILEWLLSEIPKQFAIVFIGLLFSFGNKCLKSIRDRVSEINYNKKIKKKIKNKIMIGLENSTWDDITIDDLKKNFYVPRSFKGNPNKVIDKILDEKINELKIILLERYEEGNNSWISIFWPKGK